LIRVTFAHRASLLSVETSGAGRGTTRDFRNRRDAMLPRLRRAAHQPEKGRSRRLYLGRMAASLKAT
jgi:hypothetical protein